MQDQVKPQTKTAQLLAVIAKHGPILTTDLAEKSGIPAKNLMGHLSTPIARGLAICCRVERPGQPPINEWKIGAAYTPGAAERLENKAPIEHIEPSPARPEPQPAVGNNTGSAARITPLASSVSGAAQPLPASAQTVAELAAALDTINEQKQIIANLRIECDNLEKRASSEQTADPRLMISALQARMTNGISLHIHENSVALVTRTNWREYKIEPHEFFKFMDAIALLEERVAA